MKKIKILGFGLIAVMIIMMVNSCQTKFEDPAGQRGLAVAPSLTDVQPAVFDVNNLSTTYVQFKVDVDDSKPVSQAVIQVSYNGGLQRVDFTTISSFPATVRVKLTDAVQKLGMTMADIKKVMYSQLKLLLKQMVNGIAQMQLLIHQLFVHIIKVLLLVVIMQ